MKIKYWAIIVLVIAVVIVILLTKNNINLPDSFTINIAEDDSSSGGGRAYSASLTFENNLLVSGWQEYSHLGGQGGGSFYCEFNPDKKSWTGTINEYKFEEMWGEITSSNETTDINCGEVKGSEVESINNLSYEERYDINNLFYNIQTKKEMEEAIKFNDFVEVTDPSCGHYKTCYEILK